ncbi:MAG: hypothetical protein QFX34_02980 [Candidatus Verstraetearchaeota archaeon]|nr:hypothetical protein [Candidatus Verstraetearchaeota archaeon]
MERAITMIMLTSAMLVLGGTFLTSYAAFSERAESAANKVTTEYAAHKMAEAVAWAVSEAKVQEVPTALVIFFSEQILVEASGRNIDVARVVDGHETKASLTLYLQIDIAPVGLASSAFNVTGFPDGRCVISQCPTR